MRLRSLQAVVCAGSGLRSLQLEAAQPYGPQSAQAIDAQPWGCAACGVQPAQGRRWSLKLEAAQPAGCSLCRLWLGSLRPEPAQLAGCSLRKLYKSISCVACSLRLRSVRAVACAACALREAQPRKESMCRRRMWCQVKTLISLAMHVCLRLHLLLNAYFCRMWLVTLFLQIWAFGKLKGSCLFCRLLWKYFSIETLRSTVLPGRDALP